MINLDRLESLCDRLEAVCDRLEGSEYKAHKPTQPELEWFFSDAFDIDRWFKTEVGS